MTALVATLGVFLLLAAAQAVLLRGTFGRDDLSFTFDFGEGWMLVSVGGPTHPHHNFRPTVNMHDFRLGLVAMKSASARECYIQRFNQSECVMRGRVLKALNTNGVIDTVIEEAITVGDLKVLDKEFYVLLGDRITEFCGDYDVYVLKDYQFYPHTPKDVQRRKRAAALQPAVLASTCHTVLV